MEGKGETRPPSTASFCADRSARASLIAARAGRSRPPVCRCVSVCESVATRKAGENVRSVLLLLLLLRLLLRPTIDGGQPRKYDAAAAAESSKRKLAASVPNKTQTNTRGPIHTSDRMLDKDIIASSQIGAISKKREKSRKTITVNTESWRESDSARKATTTAWNLITVSCLLAVELKKRFIDESVDTANDGRSDEI